MTQASVLIVGAGPAGLSLALALSRLGVSFRIIDRLGAPAPVSKALAVWSGSLEAFAALGVVDDFIAAGIRLQDLHMGDGGHEVARMPIAEGVDSAFPFTLILPQSRTEAILTRHLEVAGHAIEREVELLNVTEIGDTVRATLRRPDGRTETLDVPFLVGCDGARSLVRHTLGIAFEGYTEPQTFILSDTRIDGALDPSSIYIWWSAKGSVAIFPVEGGIWRTFALRDEPAHDDPPTLEEIQSHLETCGPPGLKAHSPTWLSAFRVNERLAASYRRGHIFLAGDAAHIHSPAGGQGMNTGIQDAVNLAWKIAAVLAGRGNAEALLSSYEAERRPVAREVVAAAARTMHLGIVAHGEATRLVRDAVISIASRIPAVRRKIQGAMSETRIAYEAGPLHDAVHRLAGSGRPHVGERAREVTGGEGSLWRRFSVARHTLLLFGAVQDNAAVRAVAQAMDGAVDVVEIASIGAAERYGLAGPGWVLVRPDQFIAARGGSGEIAAFTAYARLALVPTV